MKGWGTRRSRAARRVAVDCQVRASCITVLKHRLDSTGITGAVEETCNDNLIGVDCEIEGVGETTEQAPSEFVVNFRIKEGIPDNIAETGIKHP